MVAKAIEFLKDRSHKEEPFFLYFPMCPPHSPVVPAPLSTLAKVAKLGRAATPIGFIRETTC